MWCLVLQAKGTTRNATLPAERTEVLDCDAACSILRRATAPELIGTFKWGAMTVYLFGYKTGKAGTENKHELPPPHDTVLLFGEALLCATQAGALVSFDANMFKNFYNELNGGFDDLDDEEEDDADDDEEEDEEEEEEAAAEEDEEVVEEVPEDEEEEAPPVRIVKVAKAKKGSKKVPAWFSLQELTPEKYEL
jgi:hypothetical protein